jgi:hypothetical protein
VDSVALIGFFVTISATALVDPKWAALEILATPNYK